MTKERDTNLVEEAEALIGTNALWRGQILHAGVDLGIFRVLDADPIAASDIADELDLDSDRTYRLLRALAHFGVLEEDADHRFSVTRLGELFRGDHPHSVQSELIFNRDPVWLRSMLHLPDVVEDGGPNGFVREFGNEFFEYTATHPEFASHYNELMELASHGHSEQVINALNEYGCSRFSRVCDVGGGRGYFLCHLLKHIPHLDGVVLDLPRVVAAEDRRWAPKLGLSDRCTYVGGDMFNQVPDADAYFLKWILHNWDDADCHQILSTIHETAPPDGRLFVLETLVPGAGTAHDSKRLDITMMTQVGGRERTEEEYARLLERAGWDLAATWETDEGPLTVLEAVKR